ncbi:carbohydrate binding domain-containing protein [Jonesia denitrificans]|uniref:Alpha-amylase n=1 Tax=Jonesia denitrificans (strain ATCC 14870 / DSM 20603 / BCRC 15368 / CIP 55.134 / JCM 11481 / NBRC 15587 / NCTC 10816 / Prevot 55134) TaxID=471856 RepID=C7R011_JONDD|nr:carbohydrate binding domain-containing protein [Jonesia denitrificans]ACV09569.1 alpha amylase catalytic region [Jonesia denitrificans DSM 20603]ASE09204.1 alpha-amylase [Jonesia denitrificans]QXB43747.1 alpha amylase C-terminal domain-containing protein [Jonesia denitrificans]
MRMHTPTERTPRTRRVWRIGYPMIATLSTAFLLIVAGAVPASSAPQLDLPRVASTDVDTGLVRSVDGEPSGTHVIANLFQWNWTSVAQECTTSIGPAGYDYVQVSPPQEHVLGDAWWTSYQPVSYRIESKLGTRAEFEAMVDTCRDAGVGIIADAVINHMSGSPEGEGWAGTPYSEENYPGPEGQYTPANFNDCKTDIADYNNREQVQNCRLVGLQDLATGTDYVRQEIAAYLDDLADLGVAGYRIDAAKHMPAADLEAIKAATTTAKNLYWVHEVIGSGGEPIQPSEYLGSGDSHEFNYARTLRSRFGGDIADLQLLGTHLTLLPSDDAGVFVDNHDTERNGETLSYKDGDRYVLANVFMLSYPYGLPTVYSGYEFSERDAGAPQDSTGLIDDVTCADGAWTCMHRNPVITSMVGFAHHVAGEPVTDWATVSENVIGYGRDDKGFVVINNSADSVTHTFTTSLPAGTYCDVLASDCTELTVDAQGTVDITVAPMSAVALSTDNASNLQPRDVVVPDTVTVYYSTAAGWDDYYLHYGVGDSWTTVPGEQMQPACDGFVAAQITTNGTPPVVTFNDGSGTWDSNNGANYTVTREHTLIRNGVTHEMDPCSFDRAGQTTVYYAVNPNWVEHRFHYSVGLRGWTQVPGDLMYPACEGWVKKTIDTGGEDIEGVFNSEGMEWDNNQEQNYHLSGRYVHVNEGTVTSGNPCDGQDELDEPTTPEPEPEEPANPDYTTTRVYYRSADQWATTYIHFGVAGGAWTEVPGIEMAQVCDGWLRHDIDSEGRRVQVAFNDGGENWDSNNGANYQVTSESVTIEDGVLAEGDPCPTVTEPDTDNPDNADDTDSGQGSGDNPGTDSGVEGDDLQAGAGAGSGGAGDELADTGADLMAVLALSALSILLAGMGFMVRKGRLGRQSIR